MQTATKQAGFTLVELMITLVIIAIITAIAVPAYTDYLKRGRIPDATAGLAQRQLQNEQFFQDNRTYASATGCTSDTTTSRYFDFSCSASSATAYTLQAVGKGAMAGFTFTVNQSNGKTTAAVPSGWSQPSPNNCWITNKSGQC